MPGLSWCCSGNGGVGCGCAGFVGAICLSFACCLSFASVLMRHSSKNEYTRRCCARILPTRLARTPSLRQNVLIGKQDVGHALWVARSHVCHHGWSKQRAL